MNAAILPGVFVLVLVNLLAIQATGWRAVEFRGPRDQAGGATACRWDPQASGVFRRDANNRIEIECAAPIPRTILRCDVPGFESRDLTLAELCTSHAVVLDAGHLGRVDTETRSDIGVAWLRWPDAPAPEIRAERRAASVSSFALLSAPDSFVRFLVAGSSPITIPAVALSAEQPWVLANPGAGGELFVKHESGRVVPEAVEVAETRSPPIALTDGWLSRPALSRGIYTLRRVYAGGLKTRSLTAAIEDGRSTDAWMPLEQVGGVNITANRPACEPGDRMEILDARRDPPLLPIGQSSTCQWRVGGLTPGPYVIKLSPAYRDVPGIARTVTVKPQEWIDVVLVGSGVTVHGQVTLLGEPVAGVELAFGKIGDAPDSVSTVTNQEGKYVIALDAPGTYDAMLRSELSTRSEQLSFDLGDNLYNIRVKGGKIRVTFPQPAPQETASLWIDGPSGKSSRHSGRTSSSIDFVVFEYGRYGIGGFAEAGRNKGLPADRYQTVEIDERTPGARLLMTFAPFNEELALTELSGRPLTNIRVILPGLPFADLRGIVKSADLRLPPETPVQLEADTGRTCHVLTLVSRESVVIVPPAARIELRFPKPGDDLHGLVTGIPGATCAVPLSHFSYQRTAGKGYESIRMLLPAGTLSLERDGKRYEVRVPGGAVAIK